jgi:hypothetical protein
VGFVSQIGARLGLGAWYARFARTPYAAWSPWRSRGRGWLCGAHASRAHPTRLAGGHATALPCRAQYGYGSGFGGVSVHRLNRRDGSTVRRAEGQR